MDIFVMIAGLFGVVYLCDLLGEKIGVWVAETYQNFLNH